MGTRIVHCLQFVCKWTRVCLTNLPPLSQIQRVINSSSVFELRVQAPEVPRIGLKHVIFSSPNIQFYALSELPLLRSCMKMSIPKLRFQGKQKNKQQNKQQDTITDQFGCTNSFTVQAAECLLLWWFSQWMQCRPATGNFAFGIDQVLGGEKKGMLLQIPAVKRAMTVISRKNLTWEQYKHMKGLWLFPQRK